MAVELLPFQRRFVRAAVSPRYDVAAMTGPRGLGKTYLAGHVLSRCMTPGDPFCEPGAEYILIAASLDQARLCYGFIRPALEPLGGYSFLDSAQRIAITQRATRTRLRVISSSGKTAMGIVNTRIAVLDEPGSFDTAKGALMADALFGALGKVGSPLKLIICGTLAPMATGAGHWWYDLIDGGTNGTTHVTAFRGNVAKWDDLREVYRVNPLARVSGEFRRKLRRERDAARADSRLRARFLSYRLNIPSGDESTVLLTVPEYETVCGRPVPDREGAPIVGVDLGGGRAWSAAVALWSNGRVEALAVAPGIPDLVAQERADKVPRGTYQRLAESGALRLADGLRVPPVPLVVDAIRQWRPAVIVCDRFRLSELQDARPPCPVEPRVSRWSEQSEDIRALRKMAADGPLSVDPGSRGLIGASLAVASVKNDDGGNVRLVKRGTNNQARDDVAASLVLAAGEAARRLRRPRRPLVIHRAS